MLYIKHRTNGYTENVSYPQWREKYNHNLWEILEFNDIVMLYQWRKNKRGVGQIVELIHAKDMVNQNPNEFSYEEMTLDDYYVSLGKQQRYELLKHKVIKDSADEVIQRLTNESLSTGLNTLNKPLPKGLKITTVKPKIESIKGKSKTRRFLDFLAHPDTKTVIQTVVWSITIIGGIFSFFKWVLPYIKELSK